MYISHDHVKISYSHFMFPPVHFRLSCLIAVNLYLFFLPSIQNWIKSSFLSGSMRLYNLEIVVLSCQADYMESGELNFIDSLDGIYSKLHNAK